MLEVAFGIVIGVLSTLVLGTVSESKTKAILADTSAIKNALEVLIQKEIGKGSPPASSPVVPPTVIN